MTKRNDKKSRAAKTTTLNTDELKQVSGGGYWWSYQGTANTSTGTTVGDGRSKP